MTERVKVPDLAERAAAIDPRRSFIVQAPAGSGKTALLIQRYLRLLAHVDAPEEIVAMTFTRKAAGEMRERVLVALRVAHEDATADDDHARSVKELARAALARDRECGWELLSNPSRLRIQTIDALCASLARQMPLLSGFGAVPSMTDDASELHRLAARETLALLEADAQWTASIERLVGHLDNRLPEIEQLLADMLARRDQWLRHVYREGDSASQRQSLEAALAQAGVSALRALNAALSPDERAEMFVLAQFAAGNLTRRPGDEWSGWLDAGDIETIDVTALPRWRAWVSVLLTQKDEWRRQLDVRCGFPPATRAPDARARALYQDMKRRGEALLTRLADADAVHTALQEVRASPPPHYTDAQWAIMRALFELLPLAVAQLQVVFRDRGEVDFTEVAQAALRALGEPQAPTDLALALDYRIRHLLVDEFQDTSLTQFALLERLTTGWQPGEGRTLFLVGDPMQSIYRFREAEVGLFLRARERGIGDLRPESLVLSANFRSTSAVVDWVNQTFTHVLPRQEDASLGAIAYRASAAVNDAHRDSGVEIHAITGDDPRLEAARVLAIVRSERERAPEDRVVVLVQARPHLAHILPALKVAGLRYRAIEIEQLGHRSVIQDLLALTRALLHPADRIAWLAILRAPWCGLTLADLHVLGDDRDVPICAAIDDDARCARLSEDGWARLQRVRAVLREARAQRMRGGLSRYVERTWLALGAPAALDDATDLEDARVYFDLIEAMDQGGALDLDRLAQEAASLFAVPDLAADDRLQVMTVHKAKGLEFDVVVLAGLGRRARSEGRRLLLWAETSGMRREASLLLAPIPHSVEESEPIYAYLRRLERRKAQLEAGRLLYVAATRARSRLHIVAQTPIVQTDAGPRAKAPNGGCLLRELWPQVAEYFDAQARAMGSVATIERAPATAPVLQRIPGDWLPPMPPPAVRISANAPEVGEEAIEFVWASDTARHVGTVVHRMLRHIAHSGVHRWDRTRVTGARASYRLALLRLGVVEGELEAAADRVESALLGVLDDARGRWLLDDAHQDAHCEYALTGWNGQRAINVVLDRTFVDSDGVRWIVDYKVGVHAGADVEAFLDNEQARYRAQLERYAAIIQTLDTRPIRLGLYFPLMRGWRAWAPPERG